MSRRTTASKPSASSPVDPVTLTFGERLKQWRKDLGLSQESAGQLIGVPQPVWGRWELEKATPTSLVHLLWLDAYVGVPLEFWVPAPQRADATALLLLVHARRSTATESPAASAASARMALTNVAASLKLTLATLDEAVSALDAAEVRAAETRAAKPQRTKASRTVRAA